MSTSDSLALRDRNKKAFGVNTGSLGKAWSSAKVGQIYKDESYYVEPDFGWLDKITEGSGKKIVGGSSIKSRISGIGLKVTKIEGESIWGNDTKVKWSDLRGNNGWKMTGENDIEGGKRTIHVQRVAYSNQSIKGDKAMVDLGEGVCMLKLPRDNGNVYLVVGVASLSKEMKWRDDSRVRWGATTKYIDEKWTICEGIKGLAGGQPTLVLDWFENKESTNIRVDGRSMLLIGNREGRGIAWQRPWEETARVAVVLGVAVKDEAWKNAKLGEWSAIKDSWRSWVEDLNRRNRRLHTTKSGVIELTKEVSWESIGGWKSSASARFTWKWEQG